MHFRPDVVCIIEASMRQFYYVCAIGSTVNIGLGIVLWSLNLARFFRSFFYTMYKIFFKSLLENTPKRSKTRKEKTVFFLLTSCNLRVSSNQYTYRNLHNQRRIVDSIVELFSKYISPTHVQVYKRITHRSDRWTLIVCIVFDIARPSYILLISMIFDILYLFIFFIWNARKSIPVFFAKLFSFVQLSLGSDAGAEVGDPGEMLPSAQKSALVPQWLVQVQPVVRHSRTNSSALLLIYVLV